MVDFLFPRNSYVFGDFGGGDLCGITTEGVGNWRRRSEMENGKWKMENEKWKMKNEKWK